MNRMMYNSFDKHCLLQVKKKGNKTGTYMEDRSKQKKTDDLPLQAG